MNDTDLALINTFSIIGLMSGTSLDGVDIAHCSFTFLDGTFGYTIHTAETYPYSLKWQDRLRTLPFTNASEYAATHSAYGKFLGSLILQFIRKHKINPNYAASHGHTIFHQPDKGFSCQIGDGAAIAAECGIPVICDFRSGDIAHGGQGAPLVPIGDELLFPAFSYCLNLGGFANISYRHEGNRLAYDVCPANIVLNQLSNQVGKSFDFNGEIAASGQINISLLNSLNSLPYYSSLNPKSLGREWVEQIFQPLIEQFDCSINDKLRTIIEHIAIQIKNCIKDEGTPSLLVTGGGAWNLFLVKRIEETLSCTVVIPDRKLIDYKEALIFAFLGLLRVLGKPNCLASVTGASIDVCGGAIYLP